jgi:hypothetical protein
MAALSAAPGSLGKTYHLCDPQPHSPGELAEMFAEAIGKSFAYVPVPMAVAKAFFAPKPVQRFFGMPLQALDYFDDPVRHDTAQATQDLGELGIECPRLASSHIVLLSHRRRAQGGDDQTRSPGRAPGRRKSAPSGRGPY